MEELQHTAHNQKRATKQRAKFLKTTMLSVSHKEYSSGAAKQQQQKKERWKNQQTIHCKSNEEESETEADKQIDREREKRHANISILLSIDFSPAIQALGWWRNAKKDAAPAPSGRWGKQTQQSECVSKSYRSVSYLSIKLVSWVVDWFYQNIYSNSLLFRQKENILS